MKVRVLVFGHYRDVLPEPVELDMPMGSTAREVAAELSKMNILLRTLVDHCRVAINEEYSSMNAVLNHGDEIAFIPPMSGG